MTEPSARVLLVTPRFFGYEEQIQQALARELRADVDLLDERPYNTAIGRVILRLAPILVAPMTRRHFEAVLARGVDYELVVVLKGDNTPRWFLDRLRVANPGAHFVYYAYDSLRNSPRARRLLQVFDRCFSFDPADVAALPDLLEYLPLFYSSVFTPDHAGPRRQLCFVGTLHSDRHAFVRSASGRLAESDVSTRLYVQAWWYFVLGRVTGRFRGVRRSEVTFEKLALAEVAQLFRSSRAVLDMQRTHQSGMTMRTFEVLASGAGLVTTNASVKDEPYFDPRSVLVVKDGEDASLRLPDFLARLPPPDAIAATVDGHDVYSWARALTAGSKGQL